MAWSTASLRRDRAQRRTVHATAEERRGIPMVGGDKPSKLTGRQPSTRQNSDVRLGIRTPDGNTYMAAEYEGERRTRLQHERDQDNANKLALTAERLANTRRMAAAQGALDLPDHW